MRTKTILLIAIFIVLGFSSCKPKQEKSKETLKAEKIAFFTEKINLTPQEAENFWPVYNEYWERKNRIIADNRIAMMYGSKNLSKMSDEEITKYADMYINFKKQESDLLIEFNEKFKKVLPPAKLFKLYQTDYDFKIYLLHQIKKSGD